MISSSSRPMASPSISTVTSLVEQGKLSPSDVLKTRQSCRKSIMWFLHFFNFLHEIGGFLETPVDAGVADVGHRIQSAQTLHHAFTNRGAGNFPLEGTGKVVNDFVHHLDNLLLGGRPFFASLLDAREQLFPRKLFASP